MAEEQEIVQPGGPRQPDQAHEVVVSQVRDITRESKIVIEAGGGVDTAFRRLFPTTYDVTVHHPEGLETGEDK
ncbi:hypothetical protein ACBR40_16895 [Nonomuraea sp. AD125B]|uniref:hypothetical protein n=1 Tax=Nonomuraea sp. AD125B TaxID=3242897 RepID=UPI0035297064